MNTANPVAINIYVEGVTARTLSTTKSVSSKLKPPLRLCLADSLDVTMCQGAGTAAKCAQSIFKLVFSHDVNRETHIHTMQVHWHWSPGVSACGDTRSGLVSIGGVNGIVSRACVRARMRACVRVCVFVCV